MNENYKLDTPITWEDLPADPTPVEAPAQEEQKEEVTDETPAVEKPMAM